MKVIIGGGRDFEDMHVLVLAIAASGLEITEIVHGNCPRGADRLAFLYANTNGIPQTPFPADWKRYRLSAGPRRNREMANYAQGLISLPGGRGTANMIYEARRRGLKVFIWEGEPTGFAVRKTSGGRAEMTETIPGTPRGRRAPR